MTFPSLLSKLARSVALACVTATVACSLGGCEQPGDYTEESRRPAATLAPGEDGTPGSLNGPGTQTPGSPDAFGRGRSSQSGFGR